MQIKIHGLQRTGTNYVSNIIKNNFKEVELLETGGWKHGPYCGYLLEKEPSVIIVSKNIYAWLVSCYEYWRKIDGLGPDLSNVSFEEFVMKSPAVLEGSEDVPFLFRAKNLIQYYQNFYFHWLSIKFREPHNRVCLIRYEDILSNFDKTISDLADIFNLHKPEKAENIKNEVIWGYDDYNPEIEGSYDKSVETYIKEHTKKFKKTNYYNNQGYMDNYNDKLLKFIESEWDNWLMAPERLDYKVEKISLFEKLKR